jgi:hypothetical protein
MSTPSNTTQILVDRLILRDAMGKSKYGTSLDRSDLGPEEWTQHALEELLDGAGYLVRLGQTIAALRAENTRLRGEILRLRAQIEEASK